MRKLTYYVAVSLDGCIAAPDGQADFYLHDGDHSASLTARFPDTVPSQWRSAVGLGDETVHFDTVLMGRGTYEEGVRSGTTSPFAHLTQYVFSATMTASPDPAVTLVSSDALGKVRELKRESGKGIWISGGGRLAAALLPEIDELVIKLNPVVAGDGIRLFDGEFAPSRWRLADSHVYGSGVAALTYEPVRDA